MVTDCLPFEGIDEINSKEVDLSKLDDYQPSLKVLISRLLHKDQKARLTMAQALQQEWFKVKINVQ